MDDDHGSAYKILNVNSISGIKKTQTSPPKHYGAVTDNAYKRNMSPTTIRTMKTTTTTYLKFSIIFLFVLSTFLSALPAYISPFNTRISISLPKHVAWK